MTVDEFYTAAQTRELDRLAIEKYNIPGYELMQRAGKSAWQALQSRWPGVKSLLVFCGTGNNGGDGFIIASLAKRKGLEVTVIMADTPNRLRGDALTAFQQALADGIQPEPASAFKFPASSPTSAASTVIVDALLGTGLKGEVRDPYASLITLINQCGLPVLAVDIPSGLCSDTGKILGCAVKANLTVTFIGRKIGMTLAQGPGCCGDIIFSSLAIPAGVYADLRAC